MTAMELFDTEERPSLGGMKAALAAAKRAEAAAKLEYDDLHAAAGALLRAMRRDDRCLLCQTANGQPHAKDCAAWPFIAVRAGHHE